jgi:hypothetical protein
VAVLDMNSVLLTKATAAAQQSAQADMDKPDASLARILAENEKEDDAPDKVS